MDGASITCVNGEVISQMPQFSVPEVEVDLVAVDLESVRRYRIHMMSRNRQTLTQNKFARVHANIDICREAITVPQIKAMISQKSAIDNNIRAE